MSTETRPADDAALTEALQTYEPVVGLETHVELGTASKMFCGCATGFGAEPNTQICPVCLGLPGALPVPNAAAIEATIRIGLALGCQIAEHSRFSRKNYFYPDMPKNFQTSQYDDPLCFEGSVQVRVDGEMYTVEIERVHLEEDTGKSLHVGGATGRIQGATHSLVDFNRAGIPLVEIVTKPIVGAGEKAPAVARAYVTELREICRTLGVSDVRMEQGSLRCDVNVSLNRAGEPWGTRTETKNVNSLRSVERAVRSEIIRQSGILDDGGRITQETRHFHEDTAQTTPGRSKEEATDYRYFPEPDLVPMTPSRTLVETLSADLPELPGARQLRLQQEWELTDKEMSSLVGAGALEPVARTIEAGATAADARKWWTGELARRANEAGIEVSALPITPADVAAVAELVSSGQLNDKLARQVVEGVLAGEGSPEQVMRDRELAVVSDTGALSAAIDEAIAANPDVAQKVRDGKVAAAGALVGAVMKATRGQADAAAARELILQKLGVG